MILVCHFVGRSCRGILLCISVHKKGQLFLSVLHHQYFVQIGIGIINTSSQFCSSRMDASLFLSMMTCGSPWLFLFSLRAVSIYARFFAIDLFLSFVFSGIWAFDHKVYYARKGFRGQYVTSNFGVELVSVLAEMTVNRIDSRRNILSIMAQDGELRIVSYQPSFVAHHATGIGYFACTLGPCT